MVDPRVCPPKGKIELADVVRQFGPQYAAQHGEWMMPSHKKALSDIAACCTEELGGRLYGCDDCDDTFWSYHCCRNRVCPKCHGSQARVWLKERQAELLPCDYFHAVVTVPSELRTVFHRNQKLMYGLLMQVSAAAVKDLCADKRHLGALPGMLSVLHTWNGRLGYHPHVHLLITGGGDAVLTYLSRYVFRTAITNARILDMDQTHVTFRWKDRTADGWRTERLPGVEFLRRFLQHVLPRGFHKVRYYGLWHPSKRDQSNRAWVLLILATPADPAKPLTVTSLSEVLSQLMELTDQALNEVPDHDAELPRCPHCGSCRTRLLGEYPRLGGP